MRKLSLPVCFGSLLALTGCSPVIVAINASVPTGAVRADGKTAAAIEVKVTADGKPLDGGSLKFSSSLDGSSFVCFCDEGTEGQQTVDETVNAGSVTVKLFSKKAGKATVAISYKDESNRTASKSVSIEFGSQNSAIAALEFLSADPETLRLKGSGGTENSRLIFVAKDSSGSPVQAGVDVTFTLGSDLGGAAVEPANAKTDDAGRAQTVLKSGTQPGTVKVKATSGSVSAESKPISITGGAVNYRNFSWGCEENAIAGFARTNLQMKCTALLADRNTQKVPGVLVTFMAEAGAIDQFITADAKGEVEATYRTQDPKPADVAPLASWVAGNDDGLAIIKNGESGEPNTTGICANGKTGTCNPRDGVVTMIAVTTGEEQWNDANRNSQWDTGESFIDLPEPFVDVNDNGKFDAADPVEKDLYIDANKNGKWDDKNGRWDPSISIWKATKFVWTGMPKGEFLTLAKQPATLLNVAHCKTADALLHIVDANLNFPANTDGNGVQCTCEGDFCNGRPANLLVHDNLYGDRMLPIAVGDSHVCSPDCKKPNPGEQPCAGGTDTFTCTGVFLSVGGFEINVGAGDGIKTKVKTD